MPFDPTTAQPLQAPGPQQAPQAPQAQPAEADTSGMGLLKDAGSMLYAALHGAANSATFGLADKASAGIAATVSPLTGSPMSYDEAYARVKSNTDKLNGENPISSTVGDVAGMAVGAGKLAKVAKFIPGVGRAMEALEPVASQSGRNILKSAVASGVGAGTYTAADEAIEKGGVSPDDVVTSTAAGALLGPAVSKIGTMVARRVQNVSTRAIQVLADKLDETPAVLQGVYDNFQAATGRLPTMAEIVGMKSQGELKALAANSPTIQASVNNAADTAAAQRPRALSQIVEDNSGGPAQDISQLTQARRTRMDQAMNPIRNSPVGVDTTDVGLLEDPRVRSAIRADPDLSQRVRDAIDEVDTNGQSDSLSVNDIDSIRKSVRGRQAAYANPANNMHNPHIARQFGNLADNISGLGTASEPAYADALTQFEQDSNYIKGFKHGNAGKTPGEADNPDLIDALASAEGRAGHQSGIASRTAEAAAASPDSATRVASQLAAGGGDAANLQRAIGPARFQNIQDAAHHEAYGADALNNITGRVGAEEGGISGRHVAQTVAAAASHSPAGLLYHISRAIPSFSKLPQAVQTQVGRYLADPNMTQQGINLLRRAGAKDAELRKLSVALSVNAGLNAADSMN